MLNGECLRHPGQVQRLFSFFLHIFGCLVLASDSRPDCGATDCRNRDLRYSLWQGCSLCSGRCRLGICELLPAVVGGVPKIHLSFPSSLSSRLPRRPFSFWQCCHNRVQCLTLVFLLHGVKMPQQLVHVFGEIVQTGILTYRCQVINWVDQVGGCLRSLGLQLCS